MSGSRSLSSKRLSFSQKSQPNLNKPKCAANNNQPSKNIQSTSVKAKPLKKSSSSMSINSSNKAKLENKSIEQTKSTPINNNNNNNEQNEQMTVNCDSKSIENNDTTVQQIKQSFPPGITVDQDGKAPISSALAKQNYRRMLTAYELTEINNYSDIYYIGNSISKKNANGTFDQDKTFQYQAKPGDHIAYRYEILSVIHIGTFSTILKCVDHKSKEKVAIKIYINTPEIHQKRQIEVENMKILSANDASTDATPSQKIQHFVKMIDNFVFRNHICIVMELLGESITDFMKKKPAQMQTKDDQQIGPFSPLMVKLIAYQIMDGLADIHRKKIIHGDLRPQNILFTNYQQKEEPAKIKTKSIKTDKKPPQKVADNKKEINHQINVTPNFTFSFTEVDNITLMSKVRIIDFGSSCKQTEIITNHIQSRFYRAPEVVLGSSFGNTIDVWSAGCIIVELFTGKPLFPAVNDTDLLAQFIETLGQPPASVVEMRSDFQSKSTQSKASKKPVQPLRNPFFGKDGSLLNVNRQLVPFKNRLTSILKSSDTMMIDFISKCLEWDKAKRLSAAKLVKHPWIAGLAKQNI